MLGMMLRKMGHGAIQNGIIKSLLEGFINMRELTVAQKSYGVGRRRGLVEGYIKGFLSGVITVVIPAAINHFIKKKKDKKDKEE
ncbi:MAG TPA: hypothetical protein V6C65_38950 [Allocoleopsis sp.]